MSVCSDPTPDPVTVKGTGEDIDALNAAGLLGVNTALNERWPATNVEVNPDAMPLLTNTGRPMLVIPSLNCTVPSAVAGETAAVSVTGVPSAT